MAEQKVNRRAYRRKNRLKMIKDRITHPWPMYVKSGGIDAVVKHADGTETDLGKISVAYAKRWGTGTGQ